MGSATITVTGEGGTNYNSISKTYAATVKQGYQWTLTDNDFSGTISPGDLVTPKISSISNEKFYVIGVDGSGDTQTVRLFAAATLNFNSSNPNGYQYTTGIATVNGVDWYDSWSYANTSKKVDLYATKLEQAGLNLEIIEQYEDGRYGTGSAANSKARLLWLSEYNATPQSNMWRASVGLNGDKPILTSNARVYPTAYWLGTLDDSFEAYVVYSRRTDTNFLSLRLTTDRSATNMTNTYVDGEARNWNIGVRPVIKVLASKIEVPQYTYTYWAMNKSNGGSSNTATAQATVGTGVNTSTSYLISGSTPLAADKCNKISSCTSAPYMSMMRDIYLGNSYIGREACLYKASGNKILCLPTNYYDLYGDTGKNTLKEAMTNIFSVEPTCYSPSSHYYCYYPSNNAYLYVYKNVQQISAENTATNLYEKCFADGAGTSSCTG